MKLMISYKGINKQMLNDGDSYAEIIKFVHENFFLRMSKWTMQYIDSDGDSISIDSQTDIDTMIQISDKDQIKIYVKDACSQDSSIEAQDNIMRAETEPIQPIGKFQSVRKEVVLEEKPKQTVYIQPKPLEEKDKSSAQKKQYQFPKLAKPYWVEEAEKKMSKFIDQRIQNLIPLIARKVEDNLKKPQREDYPQKKQPLTKTKHAVKCNLCEVDPIIGIRYKCTQCPFDLCEKCEASSEHNHNMIKMKYEEPRNQQFNPFMFGGMPFSSMPISMPMSMPMPMPPMSLPQSNNMRPPFGGMPMGPMPMPPAGLMPPMIGTIPPPQIGLNPQKGLGLSLSPNQFKKEENPPSRPVAGFYIPEKQQEKERDCDTRLKITKKCFKMSQLFGADPPAYEQFVSKNVELKFDELSQLYITMNDNTKISYNCSQKTADKAKKLGFYFKEAAQIFSEVTRKNPACNLIQLIKIVKDQKVIEKAKESKENKKQGKDMQMNQKLIDNPYAYTSLPTEVKPVVEPNIVKLVPPKKPLLSITKRNEFVITMKEYFGDEKVMDYIKFFNENYEKSIEDLISMYIEKEHASKR